MPRRNDPRSLAQWRERLERFEQSSQSLGEFCKSEGITASAFYYWRRKLDRPTASKELSAASQRSRFLPVQVASSADLEFVFPNGTRMRLPAADHQLLKLAIVSVAQARFDQGED